MIAPVAMLGWSWRTALGSDDDAVFARLCEGQRAAVGNPIAASRARALAPIPTAPPKTRHDRYLRRMGGFAIDVATAVAAAHALTPDHRTGIFAAVGGLRAHWDDLLPALARQAAGGSAPWANGLREIHPFWMLRHLSNNAHALLAADLGARGDGATYGGGNAGAQALAAAAWALRAGAIDTAIVVGYDSLLEPELLVELTERGDATTAEPSAIVAPYAATAAGFVPGEAAAALVLVRVDDPRARAARATVAAVASVGELPEVATTLAPSRDAILLDGAAVARPQVDLAERTALASLAPHALLTATAAGLGHTGAAASLVQTIALTLALERRTAPPIAGLVDPAPGPLALVTAPTVITATAAFGVNVAAPALLGAVRVSLP